ncbi:MAG: hypothetical protein IKN81_00070 [Oscillospiraceae bacterium]|nr:hypothetical protein [Oscillospiraceae bacterium]
MSELKQMIEQRREAYAEKVGELLTDSFALFPLVRDAAKVVRDELKEQDESKEG